MSDLIVFTAASKRSRLFDLLERQLAEAALPLHVKVYPRGSSWASISTTEMMLANIEEALSLGHEKIVMIDAFDMLFFGNKDEIVAKIPDRVLFCADRNLVPPTMDESKFPSTETPWRFVNGGGMAGTRGAFERFVDSIRSQGYDDATETNNTVFNRILSSGGDRAFDIDGRAEIFHNMYLGEGELSVRDGRPFNGLTGTFPNFFHFTGGADSSGFLEMLGIEYIAPPTHWMRPK